MNAGGIPNHIRVDSMVVMRQHNPHAHNLRPFNFGVVRSNLRTQCCSSLANKFDVPFNGWIQFGIYLIGSQSERLFTNSGYPVASTQNVESHPPGR